MVKLRFGFVSRLRRDRQGQIVVVTAASLAMLGILLGFVVDFGRSQAMQSKLNSIADSAALAAVDPALAGQSDTVIIATSNALWSGQTAGLPDVTNIVMTPTVGVSSDGGRSMTITWSANSRNFFGSFLGLASLRMSGSSTAASGSLARSIDFYVLLDNSPSMLLPSTTAGISAIRTGNNNCAFACHSSFVSSGNIVDSSGLVIIIDSTYYNTKVSGDIGAFKADFLNKKLYDINGNLIASNVDFHNYTSPSGSGFHVTYTDSGGYHDMLAYYADPFWLSQNYGKLYPASGFAKIPLRIDDMQSSAQQLLAVAKAKAALLSGSAQYSMQFWLMNFFMDPLTGSMTDVRSIPTSALNPVGGTLAPYIRENGYLPSTLSDISYPGYFVGTSASNSYTSLNKLNNMISSTGSGLPGDPTMKTILIVTDGMLDVYDFSSGRVYYGPWNPIIIDTCTALKSKGVKIAILYTTYDPNTTLPRDNTSGITPNILPALKSCASTDSKLGSLVYTVSADGDMSSALSNLFLSTIPGPPKLIR